MAESYIHNDKLINEVDHDKKYDNKATVEFLTYINSEYLKNNPIDIFIVNHLFQSHFSIPLMIFSALLNSEYTELNLDRKEFFTITTLNNDSFPNIRFMDNGQFRLTEIMTKDGQTITRKHE